MAERREGMESETGGNGAASEKWPEALVCLVYLGGLVYLVDKAGRARLRDEQDGRRRSIWSVWSVWCAGAGLARRARLREPERAVD